jgi:TRAP-type mannitol/chloroaromatic compound transport system permease small subunit
MEKFGKIISLLILPLIAEVIYGSLMSYFYKAPPIWGFETTMFLYGSYFMLGAGYCHLKKKHVAVDVLTLHVGGKARRVLGIFSEMVVLFVVLVMFYFSAVAAYKSIIIRERSSHQTPFNPEIWWYRCVIPITCALVSWQAFKNMLRLITGKGITKDREKNEGEHNAA